MNQLIKQEFSFANTTLSLYSFHDENGTLWMQAKPFAQALGYNDLDQAIRKNIHEINQRKGPVQNTPPCSNWQPQTKFINEPGLYQLIMRSKMPNAVDFQMWVVNDVLPTLRKTGEYKMTQAPQQQQEQMQMINQLIQSNATLVATIQTQSNQITQMLPHLVKRPEDEEKHHVLRVYYMGSQEDSFLYRGIRCQKKSVERLSPTCEELIFESDSPNAINAFNRVKDFLPWYETKYNVVTCKIPPTEMNRLLELY